ncbi:CorA family divalent cation transporter [Alsobacter sp. R-9]
MARDIAGLWTELDLPGVVFGFRLDDEGHPTALTRADLGDVPPSTGFLWIHLNLADNRARRWLADVEGISDEAKETVLDHAVHDRVELAGAMIAGAFVDLRLDFEGGTEETAQLRFILGERLLITARRQALRSIEATRQAVASGRHVESALDLFETIVDHEADLLHTAAADLGHEVDRIEDRILQDDIDVTDRIGSVRRRAVALHRQSGRLVTLFRRVEMAPGFRLPSEIREAAGRIAQRLDSIHQEIGSAQDRARLLQDEANAKMAAESNRQLYVLSLLTAVFLPATLVTGLFGMNTKGLPFEEQPWGFWGAATVAAGAALLVYLLLRFLVRRR